MKMSGGPASFYIKLMLLFFALVIAIGTLLYTQNIVEQLQKRERQTVELYAKSFEYVAGLEDSPSDLTFIFENIIQRIDFPLILTDAYDNFDLSNISGGIRNLDIDTSLSNKEKEKYVKQQLVELKSIHEPLLIKYQDSIVLAKIYYGDSALVKKLKYYPYLQIVVAILFIALAYFGFSYLKRSEQSNIWVGMSKETAHQLGTPISSLMGWTEIIKMSYDEPDKVLDATTEIENDLARLNKIAMRFSKIGSKPELKPERIDDILQTTINYFNRRLPQTRKNVSIIMEASGKIIVMLNKELFEWVIENLIKNALDAIENKTGLIIFTVTENDKQVVIEVKDNGKGIEMKRRKDIFRPGYSTKRRGWGLGLSLSKRIVEEYHNGKIFVSHSVINEGTTFSIILPK
ncbi:MAG TPA: HAMP domain-containing sensor histidine kinase [Melioribacteraceae bacterium]|nr:HAMP domain-containing sensor histidine kinase [Melioribacteraceae bacterium]